MNIQAAFILWILMYPVQGTEYLIAVHQTSLDSTTPSLLVQTDETRGTLHYTSPHYNLHRSTKTTSNSVYIDVALWTTSGIENKGILVTSTNSDAYVQYHSRYTSFAPLATTALGTKYIVSSCYQYRYHSLLVIAAYNLVTSLSITTKSRIFGPSFNRKNTRNVELKPFQTFTFEDYSDLTGTVITSTQPIAVFSGMSNRTSFVTAYEQLLPVSLYDKEYVVAVDDNPAMYQLQILSEHNDTVITFNNGSSINVNSTLYQTQLTSRERFYFQSSNPVMTTICRSYGANSGFLVVPPISNCHQALRLETNQMFLTRKETYVNSSYIKWVNIANTDYKIGELEGGAVSASAHGCILKFAETSIYTNGISTKYGKSQRIGVRKSYLVALPNLKLPFYTDVYLSISTSQATNYQIVFPNRNVTHTRETLASSSDYFYIEKDMMVQVGVENKAFLVDIDSEDTHMAVVIDFFSIYRKPFHVFPTSLLGKEYIVQTCYFNTPSEFQLILVSSSMNTDINVLLSQGITYDGVEYKPGDTIRVRLQPYQTLTINSSVALCGTSVSASHNVAAFTLTEFEKMLPHYNQLLPVSQFGQEYIVTTGDQGEIMLWYYHRFGELVSFNSEYFILVTSASDHTQVTFSENVQVTVGEGISYRKSLLKNESLTISSTLPVMVSLCTNVSATFDTGQLDLSRCTVIVPTSLYTTESMFEVTGETIIKIMTDSTAAMVTLMWSDGQYWKIDIDWETHSDFKIGTAVVGIGQITISSTDRFTALAFWINPRLMYGLYVSLGYLWNPVGWNNEKADVTNALVSTPAVGSSNRPCMKTEAGTDSTTTADVNVQDDHINTAAVAVGATLSVLILLLLAVIICQQIYIRRTTGQKREKTDERYEGTETPFTLDQPQDRGDVSIVSAKAVYSELHTEPQVPNTYESINPSFSPDTQDEYENVETTF